MEVDERSTWDELRGYPCLFLNGGERLQTVRVDGRCHLEFPQCGGFD